MPAKDIIHEPVRRALENDGWTITDDPLTLEYEEFRTYIDLGAERLIGAERQGEKIAVEIKSFVSRSTLRDMEVAIGQYAVYHSFLRRIEPERRLYIAVSHLTYDTVFQNKAIQTLMQDYSIAVIVVDIEHKEVRQWIQN